MIAAKLNGKIVIADKKIDRQQKYICPACGSVVIFKCGAIKLPYFAHQKGSECASSEGETAEHLLGKKQIFQWANLNGYQPRYEVYLSEIKQRPDILIEVNGRRIAIEFQCSPISCRRLTERNQGYRQLNIEVIWALGKPYRHKLTDEKVAQFTQLFQKRFCILFWNTETALFEYNYEFCHFELCSKQLSRRDVLSQQTEKISQKLRAKSVDLMQIAEQCYLNHHDLRLMPLIAHFQESAWPIMTVKRSFFQVEVLLAIERLPIGYSWDRKEWLEWLQSLSAGRWLDYCCVLNIEQLRLQILKEFSQKLIKGEIIQKDNQQITLVKYPVWFQSEIEKLTQIKNVPKRER